MSDAYDALVIGGDVSGLAAAALLARSGLRTLLLEQQPTHLRPGRRPDLRALDPHLVRELRLSKHGLKFAARDLALAGVRPGGQGIVISRNRHATAHSLSAVSPLDAHAFADFRSQLFALARALRAVWWDGRPMDKAAPNSRQRELLERLSVTSASAWLSSWFENDALKAALAFDAAAAGFAPSEAGSALALAWSAAQEVCGLQGAVAIPSGGYDGLVLPLVAAAQAAGAELRTDASVARLIVVGGRIAGAELASGETLSAPLVLSTLSRRQTLAGLLPAGATGLGDAHCLLRAGVSVEIASLIFDLSRPPPFDLTGRRMVVAEWLETYAAALASARLGRVPDEPALELIMSPDRLVLFVKVWPIPSGVQRDADGLARKVTTMLEKRFPGFAECVARSDVNPSGACDDASVGRLRASARERIETPIQGLLLCGDDAEPANVVSGRAARIAARLAASLHKGHA